MTSQERPRFAVLDVVEVASVEPPTGTGLAGRRGAGLQIRHQADGSYRYSLGTVPNSGDEVAGIYDEAQLIATGQRVEAAFFGPPPPFLLRDVVVISDDCDVVEARAREGHVDGAYGSESGSMPISVWVHGLEEGCIIDARYLTRTGRRLPAPPLGVPCSSTLVTSEGNSWIPWYPGWKLTSPSAAARSR